MKTIKIEHANEFRNYTYHKMHSHFGAHCIHKVQRVKLDIRLHCQCAKVLMHMPLFFSHQISEPCGQSSGQATIGAIYRYKQTSKTPN